jgi:hypothetical protein
VAKTRPALVDLTAQFSNRTVKKRYRAIVVGKLQGVERVSDQSEGMGQEAIEGVITEQLSGLVLSMSSIYLFIHLFIYFSFSYVKLLTRCSTMTLSLTLTDVNLQAIGTNRVVSRTRDANQITYLWMDHHGRP